MDRIGVLKHAVNHGKPLIGATTERAPSRRSWSEIWTKDREKGQGKADKAGRDMINEN